MKVSRKVYFLILIIEECAEIIHRTCKAIRFGMDERWKPETGTNRDLLEGEILDLEVILNLNRKLGNIGPAYTAAHEIQVDRKKEKVGKYFDYSFSHCQTVSDEEGHNPPLIYQNWKASQEKPKCSHGNDPATCGVCEDIRSGYVNTEG
jgi:hypothetical protein